MCLNPRPVINKRSQYRVGLDKLYQLVPCGQCMECQSQKEADWLVRLHYEFEHYKKDLGGEVYFPTLTYNDMNVPHLDTSEDRFSFLRDIDAQRNYGVLPRVSHLGFSKEDVKSFLRKMKVYFMRDFSISADIKYFLVSEYGGQTARPHYHMLLFLPKKLAANKVLDLLQKAWSKEVKFDDLPTSIKEEILAKKDTWEIGEEKTFGFVGSIHVTLSERKRKKWQDRLVCLIELGFVNWSRDESGNVRPVVESAKAISYITKYLHKDSRFLREFAFNEQVEKIYDNPFAEINGFPDGYRNGDKYMADQVIEYLDKNGEVHQRTYTIKDFYNYVRMLPSPSKMAQELRDIKKFCKQCQMPLDAVYYRKLEQLNTIQKLNNFFPFHLQSQGLGLSICNEFNVDLRDTFEKDLVLEKLMSGKFVPRGYDKEYRIPQYVINRIFYQYVPSPYFEERMVRYITPIGLEVLKLRQERTIEQQNKSYLQYSHPNNLQFLTDEFKANFKETYKYELSDVLERINRVFGTDLTPLVIYKMTLQNVIITDLNKLLFQPRDVILQYGLDLKKYAVETSNKHEMYEYDCRDFIAHNSNMLNQTFNNLPQFQDFDLFLSALDYIKISKAKKRCERYQQDRERARQIRDANHKFSYHF